jgi:hypothetical protein
MSNILKFHYLKLSVTGNAALLINRLQIFPENYTIAWKMLVTEYDDKRALIHIHIHSFVNLPKGKSESVTELKKLRHNISRSIVKSRMFRQSVEPFLSLYYLREIWLKNMNGI